MGASLRFLQRQRHSLQSLINCLMAALLTAMTLCPFLMLHFSSLGEGFSHDVTFHNQTIHESKRWSFFASMRRSSCCLHQNCIEQEASRIAHAFPDRTDRSWCLPNKHATSEFTDDQEKCKGIVLVKVPKGASSTSAGVAIRIKHRQECGAVQWRHKLATEYSRCSNKSQAFLFTTIRDPAARAVSTIFFHIVSRKNVTATDDFMKSSLTQSTDPHFGAVSEGQGGFQLRYTSPREIPKYSAWSTTNKEIVLDPNTVLENVRHTINAYDFLIVTERMDESLVAMALLLGIDVGDVLVTSSKVAGGRYHFAKLPHEVFKCFPTVKSFVSRGIQSFLGSDEWRAMNYGDYLLHAAANQSLDRTIERLGRDRFDRALAEYRRLRAIEEKQCAPHVKFPCNDHGEPQPELSKRSCYLSFYDFGCGYKCIDKMLKDDKQRKAVRDPNHQFA